MNKISKTKVLAITGVLGLGALAIGAGTLAYFTDTDSKTNTFTVGNVDITLNEKQRALDDEGNKTTTLENFKDSEIFPIVGSAQGDKDSIGLPVAKNYVDKIVTVTNNNSSDAWVRVYFAVPSQLDDGFDSFDASCNNLHFNFGSDKNGNPTNDTDWIWMHSNKWNYFETTIGNDHIAYNVYYADYKTKLAKNETTSRAINGLYLDKDVTVGENGDLWGKTEVETATGKQCSGDLADTGWKASDKIEFLVYAVAVQAAGFDNADEAVAASLGSQYNPWGGATSNWQ